MSLHGGDARNPLELGKEVCLGSMSRLTPWAVVIHPKGGDDLEVLALPAHYALHALAALDTLHLRQNLAEGGLGCGEGGLPLPIILRPLAPPLAGNRVE